MTYGQNAHSCDTLNMLKRLMIENDLLRNRFPLLTIWNCSMIKIKKKTDTTFTATRKNRTPRVHYFVNAAFENSHKLVVAIRTSKCLLAKCPLAVINTHKQPLQLCSLWNIYRLITAYLLLRVNLDKIMHARWDFDASSARTRRVSALDKHQNWSASALFCLNSRAQSEYAVVNLIHTRRKQTFCLLLCDK